MLSYERLSRKPILFKSFTGLTLQEFDDIYNKEITKNIISMRINGYQKERITRAKGVDRPFKLDVKNRILMVLVYYRLYITYTLSGFLFDLDQSNICRDIQKIEY
ncbi:MAG: transposase family protein [Thermoproteota archaeon]|nr:transposase family protein [Thermoproteota archaeon]